ncbi:MAG: ASCH domain-containing protein [Ignavibacteria bacterium]|nr:ASCH domain-containing protein [Ignavibacteriota bacterium]
MPDTLINKYWSEYLQTLSEQERKSRNNYTAEQWGDSKELADSLSSLILSGKKTASCSSLWIYEKENIPVPEKGNYTIVLNSKNEPVCIVETTDVQIVPFEKVDESFAFLEGEGDRSLEYWRTAHWNFFTRSLGKIDLQPLMNMPLVCEKFKLVYK